MEALDAEWAIVEAAVEAVDGECARDFVEAERGALVVAPGKLCRGAR